MKLKKVRKNHGVYNVYFVIYRGTTTDTRFFATKTDAEQYVLRHGGTICWYWCNNREDAQRLYESNPFKIYW